MNPMLEQIAYTENINIYKYKYIYVFYINQIIINMQITQIIETIIMEQNQKSIRRNLEKS